MVDKDRIKDTDDLQDSSKKSGADNVHRLSDEEIVSLELDIRNYEDRVGSALDTVPVNVPSLPPEPINTPRTGSLYCSLILLNLPNTIVDDAVLRCAAMHGGIMERNGNDIRILIFTGNRVEAEALLLLKDLQSLDLPGFDESAIFVSSGHLPFFKGKKAGSDFEGASLSRMIEVITRIGAPQSKIVADSGFIGALDNPRNRERVNARHESFGSKEDRLYSISDIEETYGRLIVGGPRKMYGRDAEIQNIKSMLFGQKLSDGTAKITLTSEAGVGKTKFIKHTFDYLSEIYSGSTRIYVAAFAPRKNQPYFFLVGFGGLIPQLLEAAARIRGIERDQCYRDLNSLISGNRALLQDPGGLQERIRNLMQRIATPDRPLFIALDDQQWVDDQSAIILRSIFDKTNPIKNTAIIGSTRIGPEQPPKALSDVFTGADNIRLNPLRLLDEKEMPNQVLKSFVRDMLGIEHLEKDLPNTFYYFLADRSRGNSLALVEIINFMLDHEPPYLKRGEVYVKRGYQEISIPSTVEAIIQAHISKFSTAAVRMLFCLTMLGACSVDLFRNIFTASEDRVTALDLRNKGILQVSPFVEISHPLYQDTVFNIFSEETRKQQADLLARKLESLAERGVCKDECTPLKIYDLAEIAGNENLKKKYAIAAGNEALLNYDNDKAIAIFEYILPVVQSMPDDLTSARKYKFLVYKGLADANSQKGNYRGRQIGEKYLNGAVDYIDEASHYTNPENVAEILQFLESAKEVCYAAQMPRALARYNNLTQQIISEMPDSDLRKKTARTRFYFDRGRLAYLKSLGISDEAQDSNSPSNVNEESEFDMTMTRKIFTDLLQQLDVYSDIDPFGDLRAEIERFIGLTFYYTYKKLDSDAVFESLMEMPRTEEFAQCIEYFDRFLKKYLDRNTSLKSRVNPKAVASALRCGAHARAMLNLDYADLYEQGVGFALRHGDSAMVADVYTMWGGTEAVAYHRSGSKDNNLINSAIKHIECAQRELELLQSPPSSISRAAKYNLAQAYYFKGDYNASMSILAELARHNRSNKNYFCSTLLPLIAFVKKAGGKTIELIPVSVGDIMNSAFEFQRQINICADYPSKFQQVLGEKMGALFWMLDQMDTSSLTNGFEAFIQQ